MRSLYKANGKTPNLCSHIIFTSVCVMPFNPTVLFLFFTQTKESMLKEAIALRESLQMSKTKCDQLETVAIDLDQVRQVS